MSTETQDPIERAAAAVGRNMATLATPDPFELAQWLVADDLVQQPEPGTQAPRFKVYTAADALKQQEPIQWVIERLFSAGSVSLIVGDPGSKKTFAMVDAVECAALGKDWLGYPGQSHLEF